MAVRKITHGRGISYETTLKVDGKVVRRRFRTRRQGNDFYAQVDHGSPNTSMAALMAHPDLRGR